MTPSVLVQDATTGPRHLEIYRSRFTILTSGWTTFFDNCILVSDCTSLNIIITSVLKPEGVAEHYGCAQSIVGLLSWRRSSTAWDAKRRRPWSIQPWYDWMKNCEWILRESKLDWRRKYESYFWRVFFLKKKNEIRGSREEMCSKLQSGRGETRSGDG